MTTEEIMQRASAEPIICNILNGLKIGNDCSIRNSIELGHKFAQNPIQHKFFSFLKTIFKCSENYYGSIVKQAAKNVDFNILKTLALNVGISSMVYIDSTDKKQPKRLKDVIHEIQLENDSGLDYLKNEIFNYRKSGTFIFIFDYIQNNNQIMNCIEVAKEFPSCIFIFKYCNQSMDESCINKIKSSKNIILAIEQKRENKKAELLLKLKEYNLLYGYYKNYEYVKDNINENILILENAQLGCCFGIYTSSFGSNKAYSFLNPLKHFAMPILLDDYDLLKEKLEKVFLDM